MKTRYYYVGLNLIAPGLGQCALGCWLNGLSQFILSLLFFAWALWEAFLPVFQALCYLLSAGENGCIPEVTSWYFVRVGLPIALLTLLWLWSIVEIILKVRALPEKTGTANNDKKETTP